MPYKDPIKQKEAQRKHYEKNHDAYVGRTRKRRIERAKWFYKYKEDLKCEICGENHPGCIEFHHKNPSKKFMGITEMVRDAYSVDKILSEIKKCKILCSNCHRKFHWQQRKDRGISLYLM